MVVIMRLLIASGSCVSGYKRRSWHVNLCPKIKNIRKKKKKQKKRNNLKELNMNRIKVSKESEDPVVKQTKQTAWRTFVDVYNEFAAETSIHGLKYTTQRKLKIDGFIWLTIVSISIVCAGFLANRFYERHRAASMRTTVVSTQFPAWELRLPAVTLCHGTMVRKEKLDQFLDSRGIFLPRGVTQRSLEEAVSHLREALEPTNRFSTQLDIMQQFLDANVVTVHEFLEKIGPNCSEYLMVCLKENREEPCETLMEPSLTPYGICCSFNYRFASRKRKRSEDDYKKDYHSVTYGSRFTLSFLMNPYLEDRISSTFYGDGIKVLIHEPLSYPSASALEFVAPSGHETIASVHGQRLESSNEVLNLGEAVRSCVKTEDSIPPYRTSNCYAKCRERAVKSACKCLPFYAFSSDIEDTEQCNLSHSQCLARKMIRASELKLTDNECGCLPECEETTYSLAVTTIPLNAAEFSPSPIYRETTVCPNATALHVTLASQLMTLQRRDVVQSWINLLSSLGGVFSLFLGCSFISLVEILYFFFICLPNKLRSNMKRSPASKGNR